jgi:hypothetical protein
MKDAAARGLPGTNRSDHQGCIPAEKCRKIGKLNEISIVMDGKRLISSYLGGLFIVVIVQVAGFALLWNEITAQRQDIYLPTLNSQTATVRDRTNSVAAVTRLPSEVVLHDTIQSTLKQELGPYMRQLAAATETMQKVSMPEPPGVMENSPENTQAFNRITNIVSTALARGKWLNSDNLAALPYASGLTESQKTKILEKVMGAINRQELDINEAAPAL